MVYNSISQEIELIATEIVDAAFSVHSQLGAGLLEKIYETCFCYELEKRGLNFQKQVAVSIEYDGEKLKDAFRIDVLVEDKIICELKAVNEMNSIYDAQILTYLKLTGKRLGFLINFNVPLIKNGIKRVIL
ncbi:MAG: GxxExxY protein [Candidatus Cloacimonetes bacterium]|nr:GxxExxY protein [Candidatus Cloacimonadota bacterium]MBT6994741.1 GxxExxY protein [Candidatus Cloacimonadota bacterium]MBT7469475.1 GxxExxY protein [Candidatus Cloacimonadota bacterium]